ncbi:ATP phosphoribosyltransferase regulatory subunit [Comamonadaceae bacterium M7527]|nr:ATP phosphoribosyltransferase regulatory subunit [Comamonadaceae bacterium M7527]
MSAWVLPDQLADVLPFEARHIEELRRVLLDSARVYGFELVMPPMLEHLESLLSGTGEALGLQTFKLVDLGSGRSLGLRADTTPQVARIDAHLLNRTGPTRLCYCGPVVHTRAAHAYASREPLQFGAELYGHQGLEADVEVVELVHTCLAKAGVASYALYLADVRVVDALLGDTGLSAEQATRLHNALACKDRAQIEALTSGLPPQVRDGVRALPALFGDAAVLDKARSILPASGLLHTALDELGAMAAAAKAMGMDVGIDLADLRGYAYYTGIRFSVYATAADGVRQLELVRGGRYDEVGAIFGRRRPAVGFSIDVKELAATVAVPPLRRVIRAPWGQDAGLAQAVAQLRAQGHTVVSVLPGHDHEVNEFDCDRELVMVANKWEVRPLA